MTNKQTQPDRKYREAECQHDFCLVSADDVRAYLQQMRRFDATSSLMTALMRA